MDYAISELAEIVKEVIKYNDEIFYDANTHDGIPRKLMDISILN